MLTLFLGAGFSKWAAGLPVATELFDFAIEPWGPREAEKLSLVQALKKRWDSSNPGGLPEQFIAEALTYSVKGRGAVLWYIVRRLSEPFIWREFHAWRWRRHAFMIDDNRCPRFGADFLARFISPLLAGIITTNYDLLVEYALGTKGFNYGSKGERLTGRGPYPVSQWLNPVTLKGDVPVAKLHGSLSWGEKGFYTDGRGGITGNALIVAPTPEKKPPIDPMLRKAWDLAAQILENSKRILVFGFAFNPYDEAVLDLLRVNGANIESALLINISGEKGRARELWPQAKVEACLPSPEGSTTINEWLGAF